MGYKALALYGAVYAPSGSSSCSVPIGHDLCYTYVPHLHQVLIRLTFLEVSSPLLHVLLKLSLPLFHVLLEISLPLSWILLKVSLPL